MRCYAGGHKLCFYCAAKLTPGQKTGIRIAGHQPHTGPAPGNFDAIDHQHLAQNHQKYRERHPHDQGAVGPARQAADGCNSSRAQRQAHRRQYQMKGSAGHGITPPRPDKSPETVTR